MGMENFKLTPEQKKETASRTVSDAELIKGGAEYDENGNLIVTEKQVNQARLEMHGEKFDTIGEYIRFNKKIYLPFDETPKEFKENKKEMIGIAWVSDMGDVLIYLDKDGNVARVEIDNKKITSLEKNPNKTQEIVKELNELSFNADTSDSTKHRDFVNTASNVQYNYQTRIETEEKEKLNQERKEKFDY